MRRQRGYLCNIAVAPSRERGLKSIARPPESASLSRSFTGAWIEIKGQAWIDILMLVAPSRERGLKLIDMVFCRFKLRVAPSRERGLKLLYTRLYLHSQSRSFTGAWIEIHFALGLFKCP